MLIGSLVKLHVHLHSCLCFSHLEKLFLKAGSTPPQYLAICRASLSFFLSQSRLHLDTWWIYRDLVYMLDSFSIPGGSIELLFYILVWWSSIPPRHLSCRWVFSWHPLDRSSIPVDTFICRELQAFLYKAHTRSGLHFNRSLSQHFSVSLPKTLQSHSYLSFQGFSKVFHVFPHLVSF